MLQSPSSSTTTTARRSARFSRISNGSSSTLAVLKSRRKVKRREFNKTPTRRWAQVLRPPQPGVRFKTLTWVPLEALTIEEKQKYDKDLMGKEIEMKKNMRTKEDFSASISAENLEYKSNETHENMAAPSDISSTVDSSDHHKDPLLMKDSFMNESGKSIETDAENAKGVLSMRKLSSETPERLCKKPKLDNNKKILQQTSAKEGEDNNPFSSELEKHNDGLVIKEPKDNQDIA